MLIGQKEQPLDIPVVQDVLSRIVLAMVRYHVDDANNHENLSDPFKSAADDIRPRIFISYLRHFQNGLGVIYRPDTKASDINELLNRYATHVVTTLSPEEGGPLLDICSKKYADAPTGTTIELEARRQEAVEFTAGMITLFETLSRHSELRSVSDHIHNLPGSGIMAQPLQERLEVLHDFAEEMRNALKQVAQEPFAPALEGWTPAEHRPI